MERPPGEVRGGSATALPLAWAALLVGALVPAAVLLSVQGDPRPSLSLPLGIAGPAIALLLGYQAKRSPADAERPGRGRKIAVASIVLGWVELVLFVVLVTPLILFIYGLDHCDYPPCM